MAKITEKWRKIRVTVGVVRYLAVAAYVAFAVYRLAAGEGSFGLNLFIAIVTLVYLPLAVWDAHSLRRSDGHRMANAVGKPLYRMFRYVAKILSVFLPVLELVNAVEHTGILSVFLCVVLFILLFLQITADVVLLVVKVSAERARRWTVRQREKWRDRKKKKEIEEKK